MIQRYYRNGQELPVRGLEWSQQFPVRVQCSPLWDEEQTAVLRRMGVTQSICCADHMNSAHISAWTDFTAVCLLDFFFFLLVEVSTRPHWRLQPFKHPVYRYKNYVKSTAQQCIISILFLIKYYYIVAHLLKARIMESQQPAVTRQRQVNKNKVIVISEQSLPMAANEKWNESCQR